jgi:hypothetical protein
VLTRNTLGDAAVVGIELRTEGDRAGRAREYAKRSATIMRDFKHRFTAVEGQKSFCR